MHFRQTLLVVFVNFDGFPELAKVFDTNGKVVLSKHIVGIGRRRKTAIESGISEPAIQLVIWVEATIRRQERDI